MNKIKNIKAKEIKDSRGNPTIEVELALSDSRRVFASCPSGASKGKNEALELRDEDGKGVKKAIKNINKIIAPKLEGRDPVQQKEIDDLMISLDGTENKSRLGANAILAVSMAVCRAGASSEKKSLYKYIAELAGVRHPLTIPLAMFNVLEGGKHAKNDLGIQEFMIVPQKETFSENLVLCNKVFQNLQTLIEKNFGKTEVGDEGGFAPQVSKTEQVLYLLKNAIGSEDCKIALDAAASQFYHPSPRASTELSRMSSGGKYKIDGQELTRQGLLDFYKNLVNNFPIISIEDPFAENDWQGFENIMQHSPIVRTVGLNPAIEKIIIVGDDLTTTNIKRIKEAHNKNACNGVILKLNQIGTVSETTEAANLAKSFGWKTIVSHRSGETMDDFIADFSVGVGADYIKAGSPAKEERMVKYKRLMEIESELKEHG